MGDQEQKVVPQCLVSGHYLVMPIHDLDLMVQDGSIQVPGSRKQESRSQRVLIAIS